MLIVWFMMNSTIRLASRRFVLAMMRITNGELISASFGGVYANRQSLTVTTTSLPMETTVFPWDQKLSRLDRVFEKMTSSEVRQASVSFLETLANIALESRRMLRS